VTVQEVHANTAVPEGPAVPSQGGESLRGASPAFVAELSERVLATRATIDSAAAAGDEDLALAHLGELESLVDLARAHDVALPDTVAYLQMQQTGPLVIDLSALAAAEECHSA